MNKILPISIFVILALLTTLGNAFAFTKDPEVFQILHDSNKIACAEIDKEYAFCWESSKNKFLKLEINQSERRELPPINTSCNISASYCGSLTDSNPYISIYDLSLYVSKLQELVVQILNYNEHDSEYSKTCISKIRALGAAIYLNYGHSVMVTVCDELPRSRGIRRLVESYWDGIGYWSG